MIYYAHTAEDTEGNRLPESSGKWQPLRTHLENVANLAKQFATPFGAGDEANLAGLLHDLGKYSVRFQARLSDPSIHGINHWSVGTLASVQQKNLPAAFAIEGHHTGMPALVDNDPVTSLEALKPRLANLANPLAAEKINGFPESLVELTARLTADGVALPALSSPAPAGQDFATALRTRMIFSTLVDADFLDTESHFNPVQASLRRPATLQPDSALTHLLAALAKKSSEGFVNQLRRQLLEDALAAAERPPGLFTLTAPTGSGKTLASLAFALRHAAYHNAAFTDPDDPRRLRRIIVVIPYTSIIEQTAGTYRELLAPHLGPDYVLEHHSAVAPTESRVDVKNDAEDARLRRARLAQENWHAPLVVTTNVQFFESLFGHRPSQCRKLHNIARSIVLFDEVQTLPPRLIPSLLSTVTTLVRDYGVTAVFGTATQPAFTDASSAIPSGWTPTEISSQPKIMAEALRRTHIVRRPADQTPSWPELADELAQYRQVLCVVNLKRHARDLFSALPEENRFHLSSAMCPAHRQMELAEIRRRLDRANAEPCRLISTQLIEAGVDVDFPRVYRAAGPLDSIIQTAGRCNREGLNIERGDVTIFRPLDHALPPGAYAQATKITDAFLHENPGADLHNPATYAAYFARLYGTLGPTSAHDDPAYIASAKLDFPLAARECSLIGDDTRSVVVRWGEGERLVTQMREKKHFSRDDWRLVQRYSVHFYLSEFSPALARGTIVQPLPDIEFYFWNGHYDEHLGVSEPSLNLYSL